MRGTLDGVIDVYAAAGMEGPDRSILSDEFLDGLDRGTRPNLQLAQLQRLLDDPHPLAAPREYRGIVRSYCSPTASNRSWRTGFRPGTATTG